LQGAFKVKKQKPTIGVFGVSGCAGCLLTFLFEKSFQELSKHFVIKSFPLIKEDNYKGKFDYVFIEGTVCFDEDIAALRKLRKRAKYIVAFGACACFGGVPSMKNFLDQEKVMRLVYPKHNHLKAEPPTPIDKHITVDYYLPQCPPSKEELVLFLLHLAQGIPFRPYRDPVCFECRRKGNVCLLEEGKLCLGPITNGGCAALCPTKNVTCYGCRGPCSDANFAAFIKLLQEKGYTQRHLQDKLETFAGLKFKEEEEKVSTWLEK
jgi:coenzyme F420-reducing hydrogenase gamma subunit